LSAVCKNVVPHLDSFAPWDMVCEVSGIEVTEHRSDGNDQLRALDFLKDLRVTNGPDVYLEVMVESPTAATS